MRFRLFLTKVRWNDEDRAILIRAFYPAKRRQLGQKLKAHIRRLQNKAWLFVRLCLDLFRYWKHPDVQIRLLRAGIEIHRLQTALWICRQRRRLDKGPIQDRNFLVRASLLILEASSVLFPVRLPVQATERDLEYIVSEIRRRNGKIGASENLGITSFEPPQ